MSHGNSGISGATALQIVFIVLKLTHVIDWSWFWVLAPTCIPIGVVCIAGIMLAIIKILTWRKTNGK